MRGVCQKVKCLEKNKRQKNDPDYLVKYFAPTFNDLSEPQLLLPSNDDVQNIEVAAYYNISTSDVRNITSCYTRQSLPEGTNDELESYNRSVPDHYCSS